MAGRWHLRAGVWQHDTPGFVRAACHRPLIPRDRLPPVHHRVATGRIALSDTYRCDRRCLDAHGQTVHASSVHQDVSSSATPGPACAGLCVVPLAATRQTRLGLPRTWMRAVPSHPGSRVGYERGAPVSWPHLRARSARGICPDGVIASPPQGGAKLRTTGDPRSSGDHHGTYRHPPAHARALQQPGLRSDRAVPCSGVHVRGPDPVPDDQDGNRVHRLPEVLACLVLGRQGRQRAVHGRRRLLGVHVPWTRHQRRRLRTVPGHRQDDRPAVLRGAALRSRRHGPFRRELLRPDRHPQATRAPAATGC